MNKPLEDRQALGVGFSKECKVRSHNKDGKRPGSFLLTSYFSFLTFSREIRGQVILRHTDSPTYRCFLPDLAEFAGFCCTGPSPYTKHRSPLYGGEGGVRSRATRFALPLGGHAPSRLRFAPVTP